MAVDYLSAMNVGSGLNVTQIVDALVDAEKVPRESQITENIEERTVSISAFAEVKQQFDTLQKSLDALAQASTLTTQVTSADGTSSAVDLALTNSSLIEPFDHSMTVTSLAAPQSLSFSGYVSSSSTLDASNLSIEFGTWASDNAGNKTFTTNPDISAQSLALDGSDTLSTVKDRINALDIGISASIIRVEDGNYALTLSSPLGTDKQIRIQATSTTGGISNLSFDPETNGPGAANGGDATKEISAASDAVVSFNGLSITRESNVINDIIPGVTMTLKATTSSSQKISARHDPDVSVEATKLFVEAMNIITTRLTSINKNSINTDDRGELAGDTLIRSFRNRLRLMTTTPIEGFGENPIYLSNFGVMTNRDGTLSLDETKFRSYFANNPNEFAALSKSHVTSTNLAVQAKMTGTAWLPGAYEFISLIKSASSELSANEAKSQTFLSVDSTFGANDGQLSDNLQAYVADHPGGTWSISGTDSSYLTVDGSGVVTFTNGTDRETKSSYSFNVEYTVSDTALPASFRTFTEAVSFNINDLAERTYTLTSPSVPAVVYAGDTFSISVDGQSITTSAIGVNGDSSYTVDKLAAALNSANASLPTPADGAFSGSGSDLIFKYNDAATQQTTSMSSGLTYSPASPLGTTGQYRSGALTNRTVIFTENSNDINNAILSANQNDVFKFDIQTSAGTYSVSHAISSADLTAISNLPTPTQRINYLAGKLDSAADIADAGADIGYSVANTAGTAQIERITAPNIPSISAGDKFKVTINGTEIETAGATSQTSLVEIVDMLNSANAGPLVSGTFSVDNINDIIFTYSNSGPVAGTISKLFFMDSSSGSAYDAGTGTGAQSTAGLDGELIVTCNTAGPGSNSDTVSHLKISADGGVSFNNLGNSLQDTPGTSTTEIIEFASPALPNINAGDKFSVTIDNNGSPVTVTTDVLSNGDTLTEIKNALNLVHKNSTGVFSVSGSDLLFTYNDTNSGDVSNNQDAGLTYIPHPGSISLTAVAVDHVHLTSVTENSHSADDTVASIDGSLMSLENGVFKLTSSNAKGIWVEAEGNHVATLYVGKSLFDTIGEFSDTVLAANSDVDKRVQRYNEDISDYTDQLAALETRMENERARYVSQFTEMESAVSGFKETGSIIDNLMESWKASLG